MKTKVIGFTNSILSTSHQMGQKEKTVSKLRSPPRLFGVQSAMGTCLSGGDLDPGPSPMRGAHYSLSISYRGRGRQRSFMENR